MLTNLKQSHQDYFNYLLSCPLQDGGITYHDYQAGKSLLLLFPYYIQVALSQLFYILESTIIDDFSLTITPPNPLSTIQLSHNLLGRQVPPTTNNFFHPTFDFPLFNSFFGLKVTPNILLNYNNTIGIIPNGLIGTTKLYQSTTNLLPRDRLQSFFTNVNYQIDNLEDYITLTVNNSRMSSAMIFCQYFNYPDCLIQQVISEIEKWLINN